MDAGRTKFKTLVLASQSPRRAALLAEAGFEFVQRSPAGIEPPLPECASDAEAARLAMQLAQGKATQVPSSSDAGGARILAADTIVVAADTSLLGQPVDRADAQRMLEMLVGDEHRVVTGVALRDASGQRPTEFFSDVASVRIGKLPDGVLRAYLDAGQWRGKAGGYNFAELQGIWPISTGPGDDPATVIGLPMRKLVPALARWGVYPLPGNVAR